MSGGVLWHMFKKKKKKSGIKYFVAPEEAAYNLLPLVAVALWVK